MGFQSPASGCPSSRNVVANTSRNLSPVTRKISVFKHVYSGSSRHFRCFIFFVLFFHIRVSQSHNYEIYEIITIFAGTLGNQSHRRNKSETLKTKPVRLNKSILTSLRKHIIHRTIRPVYLVPPTYLLRTTVNARVRNVNYWEGFRADIVLSERTVL